MFEFIPFKAPSVYSFIDPDTGYAFDNYTSKKDLIHHIVTYRNQNKLEPILMLSEVIDNYLCSLPENVGKCRKFKLSRGLFPTWKGAVQVVKNVFYGPENMCSQEEADSRSAICKTCSFNFFPDKDAFVSWSDELAAASTGGKISKEHHSLGSCMVCSCPLRALVWAKNTNREGDYPEHCWKGR